MDIVSAAPHGSYHIHISVSRTDGVMRQQGKVLLPGAFYLQFTDKDTEGQREEMIAKLGLECHTLQH